MIPPEPGEGAAAGGGGILPLRLKLVFILPLVMVPPAAGDAEGEGKARGNLRAACSDNSRYTTSCPKWATRYCTGRYESFMTKYCPKSCNKCPVDCEVSAWGSWGRCSISCLGGTRERSRVVTIQQEREGDICPSLSESESCNAETCPEESSNRMDFYDAAATFLNETTTTFCCSPELSKSVISCGRGVSCAGQCSAAGAQFCPTGVCTGQPGDCWHKWEDADGEEDTDEVRTLRTSRSATLPPWVLSWCPSHCHWAKRYPLCCFHPSCRKTKRQRKLCKWLQNYGGTSCGHPGSLPNGEWSCSKQEIPIPQATIEEGLIPSYASFTCRLHCAPGYVSQLTPLVNCMEGKYLPHQPSEFVCQAAVALIISPEGEVEVFSPDGACNQKLTHSVHLSALGHSVNLLDNQLVLVGYKGKGGSWNSITLEDPRGGLLSSRLSLTSSELGEAAPRHHTTSVHGHSLYLLGGEQDTQARLEKGVWSNINLKWKNGRPFSSFASGACSISISKDVFIVFGGLSTEAEEMLSAVRAVDVTQQTVEERPHLRHARAFHSCEILEDGRILVSGGYANKDNPSGSLAPDELYDPNASRLPQILAGADSLSRYQHRLVRLEETVFALGGRDRTGQELTSIKQFDTGTNTWLDHNQALLSKSTSGMAVTSIPKSAVDCSKECRCGLKGRNTRIDQGQEAQAHSYPWIGALLDKNGQQIDSFCSFVLIGSSWAVTSSHCVYDPVLEEPRPAKSLTLLLGVHNRRKEVEVGRKKVSVSKIVVHPAYTEDSSTGDIALLKLGERVDMTTFAPVCLPKRTDSFENKDGWVYGWGKSDSGLYTSDTLMEVQVPIVSDSVCQSAMTQLGLTVDSTLICAGGEGKGACQGDSGGPLTVEVEGGHTLVGLVSHGGWAQCGQVGVYDVYTEVSQYMDWIEKTILSNGGMSACGFTFSAPPSTDGTACNIGGCDPRLIIVGGHPSSSAGRTVETYPPSSSLSIPALPEIRSSHSLTLLPGPPPTLVVCGGSTTRRSCIAWTGGQEGWQDYYTLKQERHYHSAARLGDSILVMGGVGISSSSTTAELVPGGGEYSLKHKSYAACAIALEDAREVVLIGGSGSTIHGHVSRYSSTGFLGSLPDLRQKRHAHACGAFTTSQGEKMLLVTGGHSGSSLLSSTELLSLSSPTAWTPAASLPQASIYLRVATLPGPAGGELYCAGGTDGSKRDEVLKYDREDDLWEEVGKMAVARGSFGMVGADLMGNKQ